jgi:hypothetical protein
MSYKTFLSIDMAVAVASGRAWHGSPVTHGQVLYILGEGGTDLFRRRSVEAARGLGVDLDETVPLYVTESGADMSTPTKVKQLKPYIDTVQPDLIVVDTLSRCMPGDENSQEVMQGFVNAMDWLRKSYYCSILIVHHEGYNKGHERGSSVLPGAVDVSIRVQRDKDNEKEIILTPHKLRDMELEAFMHDRMIPTQVKVLDEEGVPIIDSFGDKVTTIVMKEPEIWDARVGLAIAEFKSLKEDRTLNHYVGYKEWYEKCCALGMEKPRDFKKVLSIILNDKETHGIWSPDVGQYNYVSKSKRFPNPFQAENQIEEGRNYNNEPEDEEVSGLC